MARTNRSSLIFVSEEAINNPVPTGGVNNPIVKLIQIITPK